MRGSAANKRLEAHSGNTPTAVNGADSGCRPRRDLSGPCLGGHETGHGKLGPSALPQPVPSAGCRNYGSLHPQRLKRL
jgi:hypothetical protein